MRLFQRTQMMNLMKMQMKSMIVCLRFQNSIMKKLTSKCKNALLYLTLKLSSILQQKNVRKVKSLQLRLRRDKNQDKLRQKRLLIRMILLSILILLITHSHSLWDTNNILLTILLPHIHPIPLCSRLSSITTCFSSTRISTKTSKKTRKIRSKRLNPNTPIKTHS